MNNEIEILSADYIIQSEGNGWWSNILEFNFDIGLTHKEYKFNFEKHFLN